MSSLQTAVKRSASTGANKKKRIQSFFIRIGSPPERKRAASEGNTGRLISRGNSADSETSDVANTDIFGRHMAFARGSASGRDSLRLMGETQMEPCIAEEPEIPKLHQFSSREVAEQLCLLDGEIMRRIEPEELHNGAWMKKEKEQLAPNVLAMVRTSNELAMMIPSEILEETTTHGRAKVICSYIKIASRLHHLRNYNSLKAVLAGLQCTPIFRLKKTWKELPSKRRKKFEKLAELMSEEYNWKLYRAELDECFAENSPCIPFLGVLLTTIVQHETAGSGPSRQLTRNGGRKRISGVEMYTILEAITVRNRLEKLRKQSTNWRLSGIPESNDQRQAAFKRSQSHFAKTSNISDSHIPPISELRTKELSKRAILVGESSGSEDEDKCDTLVENLRISEYRGRADSAERRCSADIIDSVINDVGILGTSSSDSETTPNSSPVILPRSSNLKDSDKVLSLKKKRKKLQRLAANQPLTEPFSPSHSTTSATTTSDTNLLARPSLMKTSISESLALDEIMKHTETPTELFDDLSHSSESQSSCTDSLGSSPIPIVSGTGSKVESGPEVSLTEVTVQVTPGTASGRKPLTRLVHGDGGGALVVPSVSRRGSDDRTRKVTVLEPPPIEALYDAHYEEYAEVSRSLESLTTACDDLGGGPIPDESADFYLKEVDGELTSYVRKSISLQSLSSLDDSIESHSGSFSSHSDSSSQPSSSSLVLPTNLKTGPAHLSNDTTNDNAFADDVVTNAVNTSPDRHRLRSNSIDEVFAELNEQPANQDFPVRRRRLSSDCTNLSKNGNKTSPEMTVNNNEKAIEKTELCRKPSYGPVRRRSRRKASLVLRLAQLGTDSKTFNSDDHLVKYKFSSLRFVSDYQILPELRTLLTTRPRNTEGQNYKLSYDRESN